MPKQRSKGDLIKDCIISTAYFPPIEYFAAMVNSQRVIIERFETFQKQSYRTRCHIYSANGLLALTIPVKREIPSAISLTPDRLHEKPSHKLIIDRVQPDYSKGWVLQHKRAIEAAYSTTPFFEYYKDDIFALLDAGEPYLFNLNMQIVELMRELIGISTPIEYTKEWIADYSADMDGDAVSAQEGSYNVLDLRNRIHPKSSGQSMLRCMQIEKPYYQVFSAKQGFISNLSILDLLFNEGPNSISFLKSDNRLLG